MIIVKHADFTSGYGAKQIQENDDYGYVAIFDIPGNIYELCQEFIGVYGKMMIQDAWVGFFPMCSKRKI